MGLLSIIYMSSVCLWVYIFSVNIFSWGDIKTETGRVWIDGESKIAETDINFVCATLDWWPPQCETGVSCSDNSSLLNLDLNNKILKNAIKAFSPLKIRCGGSLQDMVTYQTENSYGPCDPFIENSSAIFGYNDGCLPLLRWDDLNRFFQDTNAEVIFGLNELKGKTVQANRSAVGAWDSTNAESLMRYTVKNNYNIYGYELGNELSGSGVRINVSASEYAIDIMTLRHTMHRVYKDIKPKPLIIAPGGIKVDLTWYPEFLNKTHKTLDVISQHVYNLGPATTVENLTEKILNMSNLDVGINPYETLQSVLKNSTSSASAWVSEAGGITHGGQENVSNAFVYGFWYLEQLGISSVYDIKVYCRQSLIAGKYELVDTVTFEPNPDYYSALLWHRLMGSKVLSTSFIGNDMLRAYSHCAKESMGITMLLMNLNNDTSIHVNLSINNRRRTKMSDTKSQIREEYHLTAKDGNLNSRVMMLNGKELRVNSSSDIPSLKPLLANSQEPIIVAPYSIIFVHIPHLILDACKS